MCHEITQMSKKYIIVCATTTTIGILVAIAATVIALFNCALKFSQLTTNRRHLVMLLPLQRRSQRSQNSGVFVRRNPYSMRAAM